MPYETDEMLTYLFTKSTGIYAIPSDNAEALAIAAKYALPVSSKDWSTIAAAAKGIVEVDFDDAP